MIKPLPVKKNKFGQRVADISITDYYGQIMEEVLEAHKAANNAEILKVMASEGCGQCAEFIQTNEAEELVDIITCCVTRFRIIGGVYLDVLKVYSIENFYRKLASEVLDSFQMALIKRKPDLEQWELSKIISFCIARLESLGYDESARQNLYAAVNDKNKKRGYFEE